jgi:hypothetical protein
MKKYFNYFAYGSNICIEQMHFRCPNANKLGNAKLNNYEFVINRHGLATLVAKLGACSEGVLWSISESDKATLDVYEGLQSNLYSLQTMIIETRIGATQVLIYIATNQDLGRPALAYMEPIVNAARHHGFSEAYVQSLENWL